MIKLRIKLSVSFVFLMSFFFFKQKTAYEMRISDWSSDVCSSDLGGQAGFDFFPGRPEVLQEDGLPVAGRAHGLGPQVAFGVAGQGIRSEERRVGKECGSTSRSRWSPDH